jgi:hypothetical protein
MKKGKERSAGREYGEKRGNNAPEVESSVNLVHEVERCRLWEEEEEGTP